MKSTFRSLLFIFSLLPSLSPFAHSQEQPNTPPPAETTPQASPKNGTFEEFLLTPDLWEKKVDELTPALKEFDFRWISQDKSSLNSTSSKLSIRNQKISESKFQLKEGKISEISLVLYSRGDSGDLDEEDFNKKIDGIVSTIDDLSKTKGQNVYKLEGTVNHRTKLLVWPAEPTAYRLEYAVSKVNGKKKAEFATLILMKGEKGMTAEQALGSRKTALNAEDLKKRIKTNEAGDMWFDVPMVNQGDKGYCSVATVERIMLYYDLDFNEHQMAQIAETETKGGTRSDALFKGLRSFGKSIGIRPELMIDCDNDDYLKMIAVYNKMAKKMKKNEIVLAPGKNNLSDIYAKMDKEVYLKSRETSDVKLKDYTRKISDKIKLGVPIVWSLMYGIVMETPSGPQKVGGHTRLIIGLNEKNSEILYSDSWGYGHELKRMQIADAYAVTMHMFSAELSDMSTSP